MALGLIRRILGNGVPSRTPPEVVRPVHPRFSGGGQWPSLEELVSAWGREDVTGGYLDRSVYSMTDFLCGASRSAQWDDRLAER